MKNAVGCPAAFQNGGKLAFGDFSAETDFSCSLRSRPEKSASE